MATASIQPEQSPLALQCMEVWGGNQRIERELEVPGIEAWVSSRVYGEASDESRHGGDVYYVSNCMAGKISRFALADVSGHGEHVAELGLNLRKLMRKHINAPDQAGFARALNEEFAGLASRGKFATALLCSYYTPTDQLIICNAGHPRPIRFDASKQEWLFLDQASPEAQDRVANLPLGIIEPTDYHQFAVTLGPGDLVVVYTDALTEARSPAGQLLNEDGLINLVRQLTPAPSGDFGRSLLSAIDRYRNGGPLEDDQTLLVLRHNAQEPPRYTMGQRVRTIGRLFGIAR